MRMLKHTCLINRDLHSQFKHTMRSFSDILTQIADVTPTTIIGTFSICCEYLHHISYAMYTISTPAFQRV